MTTDTIAAVIGSALIADSLKQLFNAILWVRQSRRHRERIHNGHIIQCTFGGHLLEYQFGEEIESPKVDRTEAPHGTH